MSKNQVQAEATSAGAASKKGKLAIIAGIVVLLVAGGADA